MRQIRLAFWILVLGGVLGITPVGWAQVLTFPGVTIDPPGTLSTWANGITGLSVAACAAEPDKDSAEPNEDKGECDEDEAGNTAGASAFVQVVGHYLTRQPDGTYHLQSYLWTNNPLQPFSPIAVPGASDTVAEGINSAGHVVGYYIDSLGTHGFTMGVGTPSFTTIDAITYVPCAVPSATGTVVMAINATDQLVGYYFDTCTGITHGFLLDKSGFTILDAPFPFPGASTTYATGINDAGQIVGYIGPSWRPQAWVRTVGNWSNLTNALASLRPAPTSSKANGINTSGEIVGEYLDSLGFTHGFRLTASGLVTKVDILGALLTRVNAISATGEIVGEYFASLPQHGFKMP
jgi:hypothetical protein